METETRLNFPHKRQGLSYYQLLPSDQENIHLNDHNTVQEADTLSVTGAGRLRRLFSYAATS